MSAAVDHQRSGVVRSERDSLERLLSPREVFPILDEGSMDDATWLATDSWRVFASPRRANIGSQGEVFQRFTLPDGEVLTAHMVDGERAVSVPFRLAEAHVNFLSEGWRAGLPLRGLGPGTLNAYYRVKRLIPRWVQLSARRTLIRRQELPDFPSWPLEENLDRLLRFYARCLLLAGGKPELIFDWFWPGTYRAAAGLTHDVESAEGLRLAVEVADLEEERGLRSSFNLVAQGYRIDEGILKDLRTRGFELGVHGVYHDRSMFSSRATFDSQLPIVRHLAARIGAVGFRSPSTYRNFEWMGDLPVDYDCSTPHSDPFEPMPGGCCSLWPYFIGNVVELPYTMPQDHTLFTLLGERTIAVWQEQLDRIEQLNGLVQVLSHPDPGYLGNKRERALYAELLDVISGRESLWKALPRDVANWWRQRDEGVSSEAWPMVPAHASLDGDGGVVFEFQAA